MRLSLIMGSQPRPREKGLRSTIIPSRDQVSLRSSPLVFRYYLIQDSENDDLFMEVYEGLDGFTASNNLSIFVFRRVHTTGYSALQALDRVRLLCTIHTILWLQKSSDNVHFHTMSNCNSNTHEAYIHAVRFNFTGTVCIHMSDQGFLLT